MLLHSGLAGEESSDGVSYAYTAGCVRIAFVHGEPVGLCHEESAFQPGGRALQKHAGDVVVVTGAAQGIGRAIAVRLAQDGFRAAVWDVSEDGASETVRLCRDVGGEARSWRVDISSEPEVERGVHAVEEAFGVPVFGLVNNAGIWPRAPVLEMPLDVWERTLRVNLTGAFLCARALGRRMAQAGRGAIVNIASGRALQGAREGAAYAASKGGILALTKSLALELAPYGVRVNCVIPGVTNTQMPRQGTTEEELFARGKAIPLGRIGQPEDIAAVVAFLFGPDAGYVTGQGIAVNGGAIMIP